MQIEIMQTKICLYYKQRPDTTEIVNKHNLSDFVLWKKLSICAFQVNLFWAGISIFMVFMKIANFEVLYTVNCHLKLQIN